MYVWFQLFAERLLAFDVAHSATPLVVVVLGRLLSLLRVGPTACMYSYIEIQVRMQPM